MKIEEALSTNKFESAYHKAALNIIYTSSFIQGLLKKRTDKEKVTLQQYNVLRILRGQYPKPSTVNLIKDRLLDKMSDVSRIVDRLIQKDLVSRCTNDRDRRAVDIVITEKGLKILKRLDADMKMNVILRQNLTEDESLLLNELLDKLRGGG